MIRRDGPARPAARVVLTPTYKGAELPAWSPAAPAGGWTPSTAWAAATAYAEEHEDVYTPRVLTTAAYRALLGAVPGLHRADVVARLERRDPRSQAADPAPF
ncbi:hypothetical protein AB4Y72_16350 [Arthrobacter sp. YAF34]|uniref:hypothetical protein n=1 Tax=Arthrobacter sp. YAF34 TaxID=3233083 RepID=UPI003F930087